MPCIFKNKSLARRKALLAKDFGRLTRYFQSREATQTGKYFPWGPFRNMRRLHYWMHAPASRFADLFGWLKNNIEI